MAEFDPTLAELDYDEVARHTYDLYWVLRSIGLLAVSELYMHDVIGIGFSPVIRGNRIITASRGVVGIVGEGSVIRVTDDSMNVLSGRTLRLATEIKSGRFALDTLVPNMNMGYMLVSPDSFTKIQPFNQQIASCRVNGVELLGPAR
jgi:hypothetical protein